MRDYLKYAGILFAITLVTALCLGVVNMYSAPVIEQNNIDKETMAISSVVVGEIDATTKVEHKVDGSDIVETVTSYKTFEGKTVYAVKVVPEGYGGGIEMMVGLDENAVVTGVEIIKMSETPGLGAKAGEADWLAQFKGEDRGELSAITGATITSEAVELGVNEAVSAVEKIAGGVTVE